MYSSSELQAYYLVSFKPLNVNMGLMKSCSKEEIIFLFNGSYPGTLVIG